MPRESSQPMLDAAAMANTSRLRINSLVRDSCALMMFISWFSCVTL